MSASFRAKISMWDVHFISDERIIPKCLCSGTWLIEMSFSTILGLELIFLFEKIIRSVFDGLNSMFHLHAQSFKCFRSEFISFSRVFKFLNLLIKAKSSAKRNISDFIFSSISLRYTKKKRDESIEPCGTETKYVQELG